MSSFESFAAYARDSGFIVPTDLAERLVMKVLLGQRLAREWMLLKAVRYFAAALWDYFDPHGQRGRIGFWVQDRHAYGKQRRERERGRMSKAVNAL